MTSDAARRRDTRRPPAPGPDAQAAPWGMLHAALAFLLEVAALGASWFVGSRLAPGAGGAVAGLALAAAFAVAWGVFMAPRARRRIPWPWRPLVALAAFAAAGLAAAAGGQPLGIALAVLALADTVLAFWLQRKY